MATLGDDVRVGIYVRRSTDDEHQPYSLEAQDTRLTAYIDSNPGWRLVARFSDDASGASTNRPGLHRALKAAHAGLIDVLLVYRVDRFTRNLRDMVVLLDELERTGVVFRSATEPFDTATPMGRMLVQMLGMFAQFERDTIIDRVIAGMERKAAKGKWKGGKRPFGYQVDKTTQTLVIDPHEATIVRLIFNLYTTDRLGSRTIATTLNARGHRTTTGGTWSGYQVLRALTNRIYLGDSPSATPPSPTPTSRSSAPTPGQTPKQSATRAGKPLPPRLLRLGLRPDRTAALPPVRQSHDRHPRHRTHPHLPLLHLLHPRPLRRQQNATSPASTPTPSTPPCSMPWPASTAPNTN